jgi:hypothetical protein
MKHQKSHFLYLDRYIFFNLWFVFLIGYPPGSYSDVCSVCAQAYLLTAAGDKLQQQQQIKGYQCAPSSTCLATCHKDSLFTHIHVSAAAAEAGQQPFDAC